MLVELFHNVDQYLLGRKSLRELETWLASNLSRMLASGDQRAIALADQLDADFIELGEGLADEVAFRKRMDALVRQAETRRLEAVVSHAETGGRFESGSAAETAHEVYTSPEPVTTLRLSLKAASLPST